MRSYCEGRVFLRGRIYHIAYCRNGHEVSESARTPDERVRMSAKVLNKPEFEAAVKFLSRISRTW